MPFLGRDWRSPGDQWVRTNEGWERLKLWRLKVFENLNQNVVARVIRLALMDIKCSRDDTYERRQPYILFIRGMTRERKELTSISEALLKLDMCGAVKDIRRINYVGKLLELVFDKKFPGLSGTAQKHVITILETLIQQVIKTEYNTGIARELLTTAEKVLVTEEHSHIGSQHLWSKHQQTVARLKDKFETFQITQRKEDGKLRLVDLPEDCVRCILSRITDHRDIMRAGMTSSSIHVLSQERLLWQQMCFFHFTNQQILTFLPQHQEQNAIDWKFIYKRCYKRFGRRDLYADCLSLCSNCCSIYWQSLGHPCVHEGTRISTQLSPQSFMKLFHL